MPTAKRFLAKVGLDNANQTIINVADPVTATDAVNKQFLTPNNVGLGNVDNTRDNVKPISTAQQIALNLKANVASPTFTGTVSGITKSMVGLANVDNTSDLLKPISTATQAILDTKASLNSPTFTGTVSGISKGMVGLNSVDNTSDIGKPISNATQIALDLKSNLNSPTFTGIVSGISKGMVGLDLVDNTSDTNKPISIETQSALDLKANIATTIAGYGITDAYTKTEIQAREDILISGINWKAAVETFADLAITYPNPIEGWTTSVNAEDTVYRYNGTDWVAVANGTVPLATSILDGKLSASDFTKLAGIEVGATSDQTAEEILTAIKTVDGIGSGLDADLLDGNDSSYYAPLASPTFNGIVSGITKSMVGLANVDNTSDNNKPISNATQTALNLKANIASPTFTGTVNGITKAMVGLANVDNTSDLLKPVSTATQTTLDLKANIASPTFTGIVSGVTKTMVGLANADNTSDAAKPVSTATQTALDLKANIASPTFTGTVAGITKSMVGLGSVINVDNTNAINLTTGTVAAARLGSGTAANNTVLLGNSTWGLKLSERTIVNGAATGDVALDLTNGVFNLTLSGNVTLSLSNIPTLTSETLAILIKITQGSTAYLMTWFSGITWLTPGATAPTLPTANNSTEYLLTTVNGTTWTGRKGAAT